MLKTTCMPLAGHPDKVCDHIVETLLDEYLKRDQKSRVNIQALGSHGMVMIGGIADSRADFDAAEIIRRLYKEIGHDDEIEPFVNIERPGEDMARVLVKGASQGTVIVYGYATSETREMLPRSVVYAHDLARRIDDLRKNDSQFSWLGADGFVQVTMDGDSPKHIVLHVQHMPSIETSNVQSSLLESAVNPIFGNHEHAKIYINAAGEFTQGGLAAHAGSSGRKISSSLYGGLLPASDASFFGKDPWHPARSGTYMARHIAKKLTADGAGNALVKLVYVMGQQDPILVEAVTGRGEDMSEKVKAFDLRPEAIVEQFSLNKAMFRNYSAYNMFARTDAPWEMI